MNLFNIMDICNNYNIIRIMYFVKVILNIIFIIVPIILIVKISIDFIRALISGDDEIKKVTSKTVKTLVSSIILFFVPVIVGFVMGMVGNSNFKDAACWDEATKERVDELKKIDQIERIKNITDQIKKNTKFYIDTVENDFPDDKLKEYDSIIAQLDSSITNMNVEESLTLQNKLRSIQKEIISIVNEIQLEEIKKKAPIISSSTGISDKGLMMVMSYEGNHGYCDSSKATYKAIDTNDGTITAGYGVTNYTKSIAISLGYGNYFPMKKGDCIPVNVIDAIMIKEYENNQNYLQELLSSYNLNWTQTQKDAVISLGYNCGTGYVKKAVKAYSSGGDSGIWDNGFSKCTKASNGNPIFNNGLMKRRKAEYNLFINGVYPN